MEAIQTHNPQYVSTHQCYGLNIDLKLHNTYLKKLSTQFSISNRTLTQLLCRVLEQYPPQLISSTEAGTHVVPVPYCKMGWRCRWGLRQSNRYWPLQAPFALPCSQLWGESQVPRGSITPSAGTAPAEGQHSCCPLSLWSRTQADDGIISVQDSRLAASHTPGLTSFQHCSSTEQGCSQQQHLCLWAQASDHSYR